MVSRILLVFTAITFALAVPVLVQEKRQESEDVKTVLGKRILEEDFHTMYDVWWHHLNVLTDVAPPPQLARPAEVKIPEVLVPPQDQADSDRNLMALGGNAPPEAPHWQSSQASTSKSDQWSTSNAPSEDSQFQPEDPNPAYSDLKGKAKVLRRISDTASGVDMASAA